MQEREDFIKKKYVQNDQIGGGILTKAISTEFLCIQENNSESTLCYRNYGLEGATTATKI